MAQYVALSDKVEVLGQTVLSIANGLGSMKEAGVKILADNGLINIQPDGWYSQQKWLNAFKQIAEKIGSGTLFLIGKSIPDNAVFPPEIDSIVKALSAIDVAYHMNHRIDGKVMFDPATGKKAEGIGHYSFMQESERKGIMKCNNPYPSDFDRGIIEQMAKRFAPSSSLVFVELDETSGSRKKGGETCTYRVRW